MFNNEHINEAGMCYCGSLDCIGHVRAMLASMTADRNDTMQQLATAHADLTKAEAVLEDVKRDWAKADQENYARLNAKVAELSALKASIDTIEAVWREQVAGYMGDWAEDSLLNTLAAEFEFEATETIEVEIELRQTIKITKPIGTDIDESDFYTRSYVEIYSNSDEVEVVEHIDDASISDVSVN